MSYSNEMISGSGEIFYLPFTPVVDINGVVEKHTGLYTTIRIPYDDNDQDIYTSYLYTDDIYTNSYQLPTIDRTQHWPGVSYSGSYYAEPMYAHYSTFSGTLYGFDLDRIHLWDTIGQWKTKFNAIVASLGIYSGYVPWSVAVSGGVDGNRLFFTDVLVEYSNRFGDQDSQHQLILKTADDDMLYSLGELDVDPIELFRQTGLNRKHNRTELNQLIGIYPYESDDYSLHYNGEIKEVI